MIDLLITKVFLIPYRMFTFIVEQKYRSKRIRGEIMQTWEILTEILGVNDGARGMIK